MKKMENVISVRLPEEDTILIGQFAEEYHKDRSTAIRELVEMGRIYFAINEYIKGKVSFGKASNIAGLTVSEMIDLLTNLGIKNKLDVDDYINSIKNADKLF